MAMCFLEEIEGRIVLFDGAMGTEIQKFNLKAELFPNNKDGFTA
jgi:5-methyltetrahydrofolate--homocysteine methyltransferase